MKSMVPSRKKSSDANLNSEKTSQLDGKSMSRKRPASPATSGDVSIDVLDLTSPNTGRGEDERGPMAIRKLKKLHTQTQNGGAISLPKFKKSNITAVKGQQSQILDTDDGGSGDGFWNVKLPTLSDLLAGTQQTSVQPQSPEVSDYLGSDMDVHVLKLVDQQGQEVDVSILEA